MILEMDRIVRLSQAQLAIPRCESMMALGRAFRRFEPSCWCGRSDDLGFFDTSSFVCYGRRQHTQLSTKGQEDIGL